MSQNSGLDAPAQRLLQLLVSRLPQVRPGWTPSYIGYKEAHEILRLPRLRESWGDSLTEQGLESLANWALNTGKPAITGLVISRETSLPGDGYFNLYERALNDYGWWLEEVTNSKAFDWMPYLPAEPDPESPAAIDIEIDSPAGRAESVVYRIIRDTLLARKVKALHDYCCQVCGHTISLPDGTRYAEAHHIQPLGAPHHGPDILGNIICVCPNHHAELDYGVRPISLREIIRVEGHFIEDRFVNYHNRVVYRQ